MLKTKNRILLLIHYFVGYFFILPYLLGFLCDLLNHSCDTLMELVIITLHLLITVYLTKDLLKNDFREQLSTRKLIIYFLALYLMTQFVNIACNLIIVLINGDIITGANEVAVNNMIMNERYLAIFSACIFAPISEELVFRAGFFKGLIKYPILAYFFGGACFGLIHFTEVIFESFNFINLLHVLPYIFAGLFFCKIYKETDNIFYNILIHIIFNSISLWLTFILI